MNEDDEICEHYLICPGVYFTETDRIYKYVELDKDLFKSFMTGKININEVLEKNKEQKKLLK